MKMKSDEELLAFKWIPETNIKIPRFHPRFIHSMCLYKVWLALFYLRQGELTSRLFISLRHESNHILIYIFFWWFSGKSFQNVHTPLDENQKHIIWPVKNLLWHQVAKRTYSRAYKILHSIKRHTFRHMSGLLLEDLVKAVIIYFSKCRWLYCMIWSWCPCPLSNLTPFINKRLY